MTSPLSFRDARPGDEPAVQAIVKTVLAEYGIAPGDTKTDADLADLAASYTNRRGLFRVLTTPDGRIVGCGGVFVLEDGDAEVRKMYFLPEARRQGHGRVLLNDLIAFARANGFPRVVLETASPLKEAQALYRSAGFVEVPRAHLASRCDKGFALEF